MEEKVSEAAERRSEARKRELREAWQGQSNGFKGVCSVKRSSGILYEQTRVKPTNLSVIIGSSVELRRRCTRRLLGVAAVSSEVLLVNLLALPVPAPRSGA